MMHVIPLSPPSTRFSRYPRRDGNETNKIVDRLETGSAEIKITADIEHAMRKVARDHVLPAMFENDSRRTVCASSISSGGE